MMSPFSCGKPAAHEARALPVPLMAAVIPAGHSHLRSVLCIAAAVAFASPPARAADPVALDLGGFARWYLGTADNDEAVLGRVNAQQPWLDSQGDNEIYVTGSTGLDNGLTVAVRVEIEADQGAGTNSESIDESNVAISGGFGKIILGGEDNVVFLLSVTSTQYGIGLNDSILSEGRWIIAPAGFTAVGNSLSTAIDTTEDANKAIYITPTVRGVTAGLFYAPGHDLEWGRDNFTFANSGTIGESWGLASQYRGDFGAMKFAASAGYVSTDIQSGSDTQDEWTLGAEFSYSGFSLGGSYRHVDDDARRAWGGRFFELGAGYGIGPWGVSLNYANAANDQAGADDDFVGWSLNGSYTMGLGVKLVGAVANLDWDDGGSTLDNAGWTVLSGIELAF